MQAYAIWRQTLPTELRDRIESNDAAERRAAVKEAIELTTFSISKRSSMRLDDETTEWIFFSLGVILQERLDRGDAVTKAFYEDLRSLTNVFRTAEDAKQATLATMIFGASRQKPNSLTDSNQPENPRPSEGSDTKRRLSFHAFLFKT